MLVGEVERADQAFLDKSVNPNRAQLLRTAQALVEQRTCREFDLSGYQDEYAEKLLQLIEAKVNGQALTAAQEHQPEQALSLMEALRQSVKAKGRTKGRTNGQTKGRANGSRKATRRLKGKAAATEKNGAPRRSHQKTA